MDAYNLKKTHVAASAFLTLFSIVGIALYGLPFFYDFFVTEFGWSRARVTSGNALSKLVVGPLFGFLAGWIVDRFGPRKMMLSGIVLAGAALIGLGSMTDLWMFYLFYLFNALGYVCGGPLPNQVLISRWFDRARGKAMGFTYVGIGLGGMLVPILANELIQAFGWHTALRLLGCLIVAVAFPMAFFVPEAPGFEVKTVHSRETGSLREILKNRYFYLLAIGSMCSIAAVGGTNQHLKLYLTLDSGFSQGQAASIASIVLGSSIAGRLLMGWLADRLARKYVMLLIYAIVAGVIPILYVSEYPGAIYLFAVLFGIGLGGDYMIIPLMAGDIFGVRFLGRVMGIILTADGVAEATAPMLVGFLRDRAGDYSYGFATLIALATAGALAVLFLPATKQVVERPGPAAVS